MSKKLALIHVTFLLFKVLNRRDKPFQRPLYVSGAYGALVAPPQGPLERFAVTLGEKQQGGLLVFSRNYFHYSEIQADRKMGGLAASGKFSGNKKNKPKIRPFPPPPLAPPAPGSP